MEKHYVKATTWNAIQIVGAIKRLDDDAIMEHIGRITEPEMATETIRQNVTNVITEIRLTQNFKHTALWVAPVIIKRGAQSVMPDENGQAVPLESPQLMPTLRKMCSASEEVRCIGALLPYSTLAHFTPSATYRTSQAFSGMQPGATLRFQDEVIEGQLELPRLAFLLGASSRINNAPELKSVTEVEREQVRQMLAGIVQFKIGRVTSAGSNVTAMEPMEFGLGLYNGVRRWLETIGRDYTFHSVSIKLERGDRYGFKLYLQKSPEDEVQCLEWLMKSTQIPEPLIGDLYHWLDDCCSLPQSMRERRSDFMH